nr:DUF459 domain-containing protein [Bradyrhizobium prioritasuperba]
MSRPTPLRRILSEAGPLIAVTVAAAILFGIAGPAPAQGLFDFGFGGRPPPRPQRDIPQQRGGFGGGFFAPFQQIFPNSPPPQQQQRAVDYSRAPSAEKRETPAERNVLVLGDAMADWLAYGLEDAFSEQPDIGVIRKHKTVSGLLRYQPKGDPADWAAAAKGILATERPDAIVVMLGLNDRVPIRESSEKTDPKASTDKAPADKKADTKKGAKPDDKSPDADAGADDQAADSDTPSIIAPEKSARSTGGSTDFREDRWVELYAKKIEEMIAVLKSKGVPVVWVGLPAVRGQKATSDMLFLDALYRDGAGKAGITYVDVWDGFVDEAGRFMPQGPDFEGQIRRLRSADGVFFTKAGARKLAHYVEREITRLLAARTTPVALPSEPAIPDVNARPGGPAPRPLAGPIVPLVVSSVGTDELLGGPGTRPASVDALAARTMVKGEALAAPAGRADDFSWPRRDVGRLEPGKDVPIAATPAKAETPPVAAVAPPDGAASAAAVAPAQPPKKKRAPPAFSSPGASPGFFGFDTRPSPPPQQLRPPRPRDGVPRPPAGVGRSASAPDGLFTR